MTMQAFLCRKIILCVSDYYRNKALTHHSKFINLKVNRLKQKIRLAIFYMVCVERSLSNAPAKYVSILFFA